MGVVVVDVGHMEFGVFGNEEVPNQRSKQIERRSMPLLAATTNIITSRHFPCPHNKQNKATRKPDVESPDFLEQLFARLRLWLWWSGLVAV
ncbi:hypothetical protein BTUL_0043g00090 [Botrytis tulipae]|uniref:Uncharacterized protein n=1 Tax=Botrytis tulipae TaxID=87230 RepID=A0A4Z1ESD9_9HELO|nr:hypothetical protein BTUL_0043g00090 [Botrytis tulipae]